MTLLQTMRRHLVRSRDGIDKLLHPRRRAYSIDRIRLTAPRSIVFVCLGNVCRSPYAERVAGGCRQRGIDVRSAGFIGPGRAPPDDAIEVALRRGIDHADHISKTLTPAVAAEADAILIFDRYNVARIRSFDSTLLRRTYWLGDFDPVWAGKRAIADPWGKSQPEFDLTFERIERCVANLAAVLGEEPSGSNASVPP